MGNNSSQPQDGLRNGNDSSEEIIQVEANIHMKYDESAYNESKVLEKPNTPITPEDIFYIAVCHPEYCQSVPDMIRHAIRSESIQEEKRQQEYHHNFSSSDKMEYNRSKVHERFQLHNQIQLFFNDSNPPPIKIFFDSRSKSDPEINFQGVLSFFRNLWLLNNFETVSSLKRNIQSLIGSKDPNLNDEKKLRKILSQIIGKDEYEAMVPQRSFNYKEINAEFDSISKRICSQINVCCMTFPSTTKPLKQITINSRVLRHGICSNGTFLFVLTQDKALSIYRINKGIIDKLMTQINLNQQCQFDDETYLFCSRESLYLKIGEITYQSSISLIIIKNILIFSKSEKLTNLKCACSNGVSYSIINDQKTIQTFSSENENCISNTQTKSVSTILSFLNKSEILLTNGYFFGLLENSGKIKMIPINSFETILFEQEDNFPIENDLNIEAATIDILTNMFYSVSYSNSNSIIYCYPYSGATDINIFGQNFIPNNNRKTISTFLLNHISSCAFSSAIPDNLITSSEKYFNDLKSVAFLIEKHINDPDISKALLLLLELNFRRRDCSGHSKYFLTLLFKLIDNDNYKTIAAAILLNNIDLFFDQFEGNLLDLFFDQHEGNLYDILRMIFNDSADNHNELFNEWLFTRLYNSSTLCKIEINESLLTYLFDEDWANKSRTDKKNAWMVDLLLIAQQSMVYNAMNILKEDPLNLNKSKLIISLCNQANFLFDTFNQFLIQTISNQPDINKRKLKYDSILFALISNFVVIASSITQCSEFAKIMTNEYAQSILRLIYNEFKVCKKLTTFMEYFSMSFTLSISSLIRGGPVYQCEIDYSWLILCNFYSGARKLIPPDPSQINEFLSNNVIEFFNDFINNESEDINFLYQKMRSFRPIRREHASIDRVIMAAICHQTNTFNLLYDVKKSGKITQEIKTITNSTKKIRTSYSKAIQTERSGSIRGIKESDKYMVNLAILINLDPALTDFVKKTGQEQTEYCRHLEQFILNNDPYHFYQVLKIVPERIKNIISSLDSLNILFNDARNQTLEKIIIDGISRVESFDRLGYLLSQAILNENDLSILEIFCMTCITMAIQFSQISVLEIIYTLLEKCKNLTNKATKTMDDLSQDIFTESFVLDSSYMTVCGLAGSTCTYPKHFESFPLLGKAYIFQLMYGGKDIPTLKIEEITSYINKSYIQSDVYVRMIFTLLYKCQYDEESTELVFKTLSTIFQMASDLIGDKCSVFPTLPSIIYGFRHILNLKNDLSGILLNIMETITIESKISEIFLLFSIIAADISDYSRFYEIRNQQGRWLKCSNNCCLPLPLCPYCESHLYNMKEINQSIQEEELNMEMALPFDWAIAYYEICTKDHGSMLCRVFLQALSRYISETNNILNKNIFSFLSSTSKPYIDYHILSTKQTLLYKVLSTSFPEKKLILPENEYGFAQLEQSGFYHYIAYNIDKLGNFSIYVYMNRNGYMVIHNHDITIIDTRTGIINNSEERIQNVNAQLTIVIHDDKISVNDTDFELEENSYIEFIVESVAEISFFLEGINKINCSSILYSDNSNNNNMNVNYVDDSFAKEDENLMTNFVNDLKRFSPIKIFNYSNSIILEREGMNIFYNPTTDIIRFNENLKYDASVSFYKHMIKTNEVNICNQLKSVILAQAVIKNPDSLEWAEVFSLVRSAVITLCEFNREKLFNGEFPFSLDNGFFHYFSLDFLQNRNIQTFFIAMKTLLKSPNFMEKLGKQLVKMAQDHIYHNLIHKKDLILIKKDQLQLYKSKKNDYLVDFNDGTKGLIEVDNSGNWMIDTPMVLLLLLWIFIDNCSTPEQRIHAKLTLIDCWLISSPLIVKFLPEFLSFIQRRMLFTPEDFNPKYIRHLSSLAAKNTDNEQIMNFYEFEKHCYGLKNIQREISTKSIDLNSIEQIQLDVLKKNMNPSKMIEIIQLMKKYDSINQFPVWSFLPIWKTISSFSLQEHEDFEITAQNKNPLVVQNQSDESLIFTLTINDVFSNSNDVFKLYENKDLKKCIKLESEVFGKQTVTNFVLQSHQTKYLVLNIKSSKVIKIQTYKVISSNQITFENFEGDIKSFAVDWSDKETEEMLSNGSIYNLQSKSFLLFMLDTLKMKKLVNTFGLRTVQCKAACLFLINCVNNLFETKSLNSIQSEMIRIGLMNSNLLSYQIRQNVFKFQFSASGSRFSFGDWIHNRQIGYIMVNSDSATKFITGESNHVNESMIYQMSRHIKLYDIKRFQNLIWAIEFKGKQATDLSGVTNQTITMCVQSFLSPRSGICIISPNYIENSSNDEHENESEIQVIPYPSKNSKNVFDVLYSFGVILGAIIRAGLNQDIPFPSFVWNFLAGKSITKFDIYESDTRLKDEIIGIKNGNIKDHPWVYRDWNNVIKPIIGCPSDRFIPQDLVDVYETLVIDFRIKSIEKYLCEIRKGLWDNQEIKNHEFLSGGLIMYLCQGKKVLNIEEIIQKVVFKNGSDQLKNNFIKILGEYDENMMRKFLSFVTASQKPPNFAISPEYRITVEFVKDSENLPTSQTCFKSMHIPSYKTIDIMRNKLNLAILNCDSLENR